MCIKETGESVWLSLEMGQGECVLDQTAALLQAWGPRVHGVSGCWHQYNLADASSERWEVMYFIQADIHIYVQLIFDKKTKAICWRKI